VSVLVGNALRKPSVKARMDRITAGALIAPSLHARRSLRRMLGVSPR
jgi:hypothetical protein